MSKGYTCMDCARQQQSCPHPIPTAPGTSLEQRFSYMENEIEYWNKRYKVAQAVVEHAEKRVEELKDHTRDQAKGHRQDLLCWTIEKQRFVKLIKSLKAARDTLVCDKIALAEELMAAQGELKQEGTPSERKVLASVGTPRRMGRVEKDSVELGNDQDTCPTGVPISTTEESRNDYIAKLEAIIERQGEIINQQMKELSRPDCKEKCRHRDDCNYPRCMPGEEEDG